MINLKADPSLFVKELERNSTRLGDANSVKAVRLGLMKSMIELVSTHNDGTISHQNTGKGCIWRMSKS